jgi:2-methylcitrate dehydratase PrpD
MMVNAFGLAYHQAAGNLQCIHDGALAKRMGPGFAVRDGMMSVLLSRNGITGAKEVLEGRHGFFRVYHGGHYKREVLLEDLGSGKWLQELGFKAYSACRRTHTSIDATLGIVRRHQIKAEEVDAIVVTMDSTHSRMFCEPAEVKRNPRNEVDAQFSIPYTVGAAIVRGKVGLDAFTDKALRDPAILALSNRVEVRIDDSLKRKSHSPGVVEIRTRDGRVYSHRAEAPTGSPENPMDMVSIAEKFRTCAENAAKPLNSENVERLLELCNRLETVADIREIVRLIG